jgi:small subunit ribosomal protein S17
MSTEVSTLTGVVVSLAPKSLVVLVSRKEKNKLGKYIKRSTKMHVHDEQMQANLKDVVEIVPSRPFSKQKTWKLHAIVEQSATQVEEKS